MCNYRDSARCLYDLHEFLWIHKKNNEISVFTSDPVTFKDESENSSLATHVIILKAGNILLWKISWDIDICSFAPPYQHRHILLLSLSLPCVFLWATIASGYVTLQPTEGKYLAVFIRLWESRNDRPEKYNERKWRWNREVVAMHLHQYYWRKAQHTKIKRQYYLNTKRYHSTANL